MSLTLYHLHYSQCDRIIWLCEELSTLIPTFTYSLKIFARGLAESEGKQTLLSLHPSGTSPTIVDTLVSPPITMTESEAILTYIINVHGQGHFQATPDQGVKKYSRYLYWMAFANGSFQANLTACMSAEIALAAQNVSPEDALTDPKMFVYAMFKQRINDHLRQYNTQLSQTRYLVSDEFTAADFMNVYALTTFRTIYPVDITEYKELRRYLKDITGREAYGKMMRVAEDGMPAMVEGVVPRLSMQVLGSLESWRTAMGEDGRALR